MGKEKNKMIRILKSVALGDKTYQEIALLSTDTKPTAGIATGSIAFVVDEGNFYAFDEESGEWKVQ